MFSTASKTLLGTGLAAVAIGIVAIVWPGVTLAFAVGIFAVIAVVSAVVEFERAFSSDTAGPVVGHVLLGVIDVVAGVGSIVYPGLTVLILTVWIAAWAVVLGAGRFAMAFAEHEGAGQRALYGFGGLLSMALGAVLFARPDVGAVSLAEVFGLYSLAYGTWSIVLAASARSAGADINAALRRQA